MQLDKRAYEVKLFILYLLLFPGVLEKGLHHGNETVFHRSVLQEVHMFPFVPFLSLFLGLLQRCRDSPVLT
jgi:hypothetical protein